MNENKSNNIKGYLKESRDKEIDATMNDLITGLEKEGFSVEFGNIGVRTTYALIYTKDHEEEVVGYTFLKNMKFYKEKVGKLKALQQAIARKNTSARSE